MLRSRDLAALTGYPQSINPVNGFIFMIDVRDIRKQGAASVHIMYTVQEGGGKGEGEERGRDVHEDRSTVLIVNSKNIILIYQ